LLGTKPVQGTLLGDLRASFKMPSGIGNWDVYLMLDDGSRMSREAHVRFCEGLWVKFPRSTHPYIATGEGWLYLAGVKDVFTCELVGYAMGPRMTQDLAAQALWRAVRNKRPAPGLIHHSDRGSQYW